MDMNKEILIKNTIFLFVLLGFNINNLFALDTACKIEYDIKIIEEKLPKAIEYHLSNIASFMYQVNNNQGELTIDECEQIFKQYNEKFNDYYVKLNNIKNELKTTYIKEYMENYIQTSKLGIQTVLKDNQLLILNNSFHTDKKAQEKIESDIKSLDEKIQQLKIEKQKILDNIYKIIDEPVKLF